MSTASHFLPNTVVTILIGWASTGYGWLFADMPGIAVLGSVTALVLTCLKLHSYWKGKRAGTPFVD